MTERDGSLTGDDRLIAGLGWHFPRRHKTDHRSDILTAANHHSECFLSLLEESWT